MLIQDNGEKFQIDINLLKQYSKKFDQEKQSYLEQNFEDVKKILLTLKKQEQNLNGKEIKENELLSIFVYVFRYIFGKQSKSVLNKNLRAIKGLLNEYLLILHQNQEKINLFLRQNSEKEFSIFILGKKYKGNALELDEINKEKIYYIHYLLNELEVIQAIIDGLDTVIENIFNTKVYYEKLEEVLKKIAKFVLLVYSDDKEIEGKQEEEKSKAKKITLINAAKKIYNNTILKFKNDFQKAFKQASEINKKIKNVYDFMNHYNKYKEVLEEYFNRLYNKKNEFEMEFEFYIIKKH